MLNIIFESAVAICDSYCIPTLLRKIRYEEAFASLRTIDKTMPTWEGIEDISPKPNCLWLTRPSDDKLWTPLRKSDCRALNESPGKDPVYIDGGRQTADRVEGVIRHNFYHDAPTTQLSSATWFVKEENPQKKPKYLLHPMSELDRDLVEDLYQRAVAATSSLGSGIEAVLQEKYVLQDDADYHVMVAKVGNTLSMKKKHKGWFGASLDLQRGWGEYVVEGEEEELLLGPVQQVVFVVHGIGEAMWSRDIKSKSVVGEVNKARITMQKVQVEEYRKKLDEARKAGEADPPPPKRIELLPIEWYDRIHSSSNALMTSLKATTIQSIPALRAIANDVIFDVLMYMTPAFCHSVLECVTEQITNLYHRFQEVHPDWNGSCSIVGHSLGSVIVWDLLCVLRATGSNDGRKPVKNSIASETGLLPDMKKLLNCGIAIEEEGSPASPHGYQAYATADEHANTAENGAWGPTLPKPLRNCIPFVPDFALFLGSPIGLFLTLRGAHPVFDEMTKQADRAKLGNTEDGGAFHNSIVSPFTLPAGSIYNIFHPSDPVAYRIEPLLLPQDTTNICVPPPKYLVPEGQDVRFHVKAREFTKAFAEKTNYTWSSLVSQVAEQAVALSTEVTHESSDARHHNILAGEKFLPTKFPLGGRSQRIDYQIQTGAIESEYISAVMAHSSYFANVDVLEFILNVVEDKSDTNSAAGSIDNGVSTH